MIFKFKKVDIFSIAVLGHGIKPLGHAIIDELFVFLSLKHLILTKTSVSFSFGLMIGLWCSFCAFLSIIFGPLDLLHSMHSLVIGLAIIIVSQIQWRKGYLRRALPVAALFLVCNLIFVGVEQLALLLSGNSAIECFNVAKKGAGCWLNVAFWQNFWTGTAYSGLGLFISAVLLLANTRKQRTSHIIILIYFVIAIFQLSKVLIVFGVFLIFLSVKKLRSLIKLLRLIALFVAFELCIWFFPIVDIISADNFLSYFNKSYSVSALSYFNRSFFDPGRLEQIISLWNYIINQDLMTNLFGRLSGFHRYGLQDYFTQDTTGMLRPIGIVVWAVDFGFIFITLYMSIIFGSLLTILRSDFDIYFFTKVQCLLAFCVISLMPLITNIHDSMLFWFVILFPKLLVELFRRSSHWIE